MFIPLDFCLLNSPDVNPADYGIWGVIQSKSKAKKSKAKMCNEGRHVPLCPACANEK